MRLTRLFLVACLVSIPLVATAQISISDLHQNDASGIALMLGQTVTVQGVVTVPTGVFHQDRTEVYIQDGTGGINIFNFEPVTTYALGDEVLVTGEVDQYRGHTEVIPETVQLIAQNQPLPEPMTLSCAEVRDTYIFADNTEPNESRLVRVNNVTWDPDSYALTDATGTTMMYIDYDTGIQDNPPTGEFNLVGIIKQYDEQEPPYYLGYEILPRFPSDIIYGSGPQFATWPHQTEVGMGSATIAWETDVECPTVLELGTTPDFEMDPIDLGNSTTNHVVVLEHLPSATVYYCRAVATNASASTTSPPITIVSPAESSSGQIDVYFSRSIDTAYSTGVDAITTDISLRMIELIDAATHSIDVCYYAFTLDDVADALVAAHQRGVAVRMIYDQGDSAVNVLTLAGIEVRSDGDEEHLMHNKFAVFDAGDGDETNDVVWTGSWNATHNGTHSNAENVVVIQDAALAAAYSLEFEEMWGGTFGSSKANNTPHMFLIGGTRAESHMSPTDGPQNALRAVIAGADTDILFAIYSFSDYTITNAMGDRFGAGVAVRGVFDAESSNYQYSQFQPMLDWGADVVLDNVEQGGEDEMLHHKYLLADSFQLDSNPTVVTGSYNWSFSAANDQDENLLVIHDATIANIFFQEWMARYHEAGGTWDYEIPEVLEAEFTWDPMAPTTGEVLTFTDASTGEITGWAWDFGDTVGTSTDQSPTYTYDAAGTYTVTLEVTDGTDTVSVSHDIEVTDDVAPLPETYIVPAAALAGGLGSFWVTDVDVNNAGDAMMTYQFMYVPREEAKASKVSPPYTLGVGMSMRFGNVLQAAFGLTEGLGALVMVSDSADARLMSRTFNQTDTGTYGQSILGYHTSQLNADFDPLRVLFMTEDDDYRSNLGIMNGTDEANHIGYELFGADGVSLGSGSVDLGAYGNTQLNRVFEAFAPVEAAYVDVWSETAGGLFTCYGSVLDMVTSDPTTILPQ